MPILRLDDDEARRLRELLDRVLWQAGVGAGGFGAQDVRTADAIQEALRRSSLAPGALGPLVAAGGRARASRPSRWRRLRERARRAAAAGAAAGGADARATP